jgi:iron complex outermembrane receptor protein
LYYPEFDERISSNPGATNNGVAQGRDDDMAASFFGSASYRDFTLQGGYSQREKGNPTALIGADFNDTRHRTTDERSYGALKYARSFTEIVDVTAQVYYDRYDFEIGYPVGTSLFKDVMVGEWWGAELQLNKRIWQRHILTLGAEYRDDFRQQLRGVDESTGLIYNEVNRDRQSHGVYAQGDFAVLTNLHLNAGARYDQYGDFDPAFNPRLALIYNPFKSSTLKGLYGTAFRAPNFMELSDPRFQDIKPEEITAYELVYEQEIGRHLRSSVSAFYNQMDDLIVLRDGSFTNFNADTKGLELALEGFWTNGIRCRLSYSLQNTDDRSTSTVMADSPTHLFKANVSVPVFRDEIFAGLEFLYTSRRHTVFTSNTGGATLAGDDTPGFGLVNFTLYSRNLVKDLEFSASVYNLLDEEYGDPASRGHSQDIIPRDGRSFRLKLTYRF